MKTVTLTPLPGRENGAILVTSLIFLAITVILGLSAVRVSTMELRIANNEEASLSAFQAAQALSDAVVAMPSTTPVIGGPGYTICTTFEANCDTNDLNFPGGLFASDIGAGHLSARIQRLSPALRPPPRGIESSADKFSAAAFQVGASFDRADEGLGRYDTVEGVLILVPTN